VSAPTGHPLTATGRWSALPDHSPQLPSQSTCFPSHSACRSAYWSALPACSSAPP